VPPVDGWDVPEEHEVKPTWDAEAADRERQRLRPCTTVLDWRDSSHWSHTAAPCIHCGGQTNLRNESPRPSHKVCAERLLDRKSAGSI
jgi:hypothetical protein